MILVRYYHALLVHAPLSRLADGIENSGLLVHCFLSSVGYELVAVPRMDCKLHSSPNWDLIRFDQKTGRDVVTVHSMHFIFPGVSPLNYKSS